MEGIVRAVGWSYESAAIWQFESTQGHSEGPKEIGTRALPWALMIEWEPDKGTVQRVPESLPWGLLIWGAT